MLGQVVSLVQVTSG